MKEDDGSPRIVSLQLGRAHTDLQQHSESRIDSPKRPKVRSQTRSIWVEQSGATAFVFALIATGIIAMVGLGIYVIGWYRTDRVLQNAADAAAVAAARNGTSSYDSEAKAVAASYGFVDGNNGITVTPLGNQTCPNGVRRTVTW